MTYEQYINESLERNIPFTEIISNFREEYGENIPVEDFINAVKPLIREYNTIRDQDRRIQILDYDKGLDLFTLSRTKRKSLLEFTDHAHTFYADYVETLESKYESNTPESPVSDADSTSEAGVFIRIVNLEDLLEENPDMKAALSRYHSWAIKQNDNPENEYLFTMDDYVRGFYDEFNCVLSCSSMRAIFYDSIMNKPKDVKERLLKKIEQMDNWGLSSDNAEEAYQLNLERIIHEGGITLDLEATELNTTVTTSNNVQPDLPEITVATQPMPAIPQEEIMPHNGSQQCEIYMPPTSMKAASAIPFDAITPSLTTNPLTPVAIHAFETTPVSVIAPLLPSTPLSPELPLPVATQPLFDVRIVPRYPSKQDVPMASKATPILPEQPFSDAAAPQPDLPIARKPLLIPIYDDNLLPALGTPPVKQEYVVFGAPAQDLPAPRPSITDGSGPDYSFAVVASLFAIAIIGLSIYYKYKTKHVAESPSSNDNDDTLHSVCEPTFGFSSVGTILLLLVVPTWLLLLWSFRYYYYYRLLYFIKKPK